jgi:hypothetical protein
MDGGGWTLKMSKRKLAGELPKLAEPECLICGKSVPENDQCCFIDKCSGCETKSCTNCLFFVHSLNIISCAKCILKARTELENIFLPGPSQSQS